MKIYVRFKRGRDGVIGPILGPFDFVQLMYQWLRDDKGQEIAYYDHEDGDWLLTEVGASTLSGSLERNMSIPYSDFIIYAEDK